MGIRNQAFALVTALVVLAVLVTLAFGAAFLANMNLRIAENTRTQLIAQTHAQEGLDVSFISLARAYKTWLENELEGSDTPGELSGDSLFEAAAGRMPQTGDYQLVEFEDFAQVEDEPSRGTAVVVVRGFGPRAAEHISRARFETVVDASSGSNPGEFSDGFVTDGEVDFNGTGAYNINFYGRDLVDVNGNSTIGAGFVAESLGDCQIGKTECTTLNPDDAKNLPLFIWEDYSLALLNDPTALLDMSSDPETVDLSSTSRLSNPVASADPIPTLKTQVDLSAIDGGTSNGGGVACDTFVDSNLGLLNLTSSDDDTTICLEPNTSITIDGTATDLFIVGDETTYVDFRGESAPVDDDPTNLGVAIIAGGVDLSDGGNKKDPENLLGRNFIYSYDSIQFDKGVLSDNPSGDGDGEYARTIIASQGDIDMNGAGNEDIANAVFWAAGSWCINGRIGTFRGTVLANVDESSSGDGCNSGDQGIRGNGSIRDAALPDGIDVNVPGGGAPSIDLTSVGIKVLAKTP